MPAEPRPVRAPPSPDTVRRQWTEIASSFDATRDHPWDAVMRWAGANLRPGMRVLDLACGNARHGRPLARARMDVVAVDLTRGLLDSARERGDGDVHLVQGDAGNLPLRTGSMDGALFVAGIHHVPRRARRIAALSELRRVLVPGAPALVTSWARWQDRWVRELLMDLPAALLEGRDPGERNVPWHHDGQVVDRYYHLYTRRELHEDLRAAGFREVRVAGRHLTGSRLPDNWFGCVRR